MRYYITINGRTVGPMSAQQPMYYDIDSNTPSVARRLGLGSHVYLSGTYGVVQQAPRQGVSAGTDGVSQRLLCGLLAIFLGYLGIQYFWW